MNFRKNFQSKFAVNLFLKSFTSHLKSGHCFFLSGDLGVGKTYFCQQIIKYLISDKVVSSPTYNIVNTYYYKENIEIWHCDLYRLNSYNEVLELGVLDNTDQKILLVEWPNLLENVIKDPIKFRIYFGEKECERNVLISLPKSFKNIY